MKNLSILGSTGSIGCNTLEIVRKFPDRFSVKTLAAGRNIDLLAKQIKEFKPDIVAVLDDNYALKLKSIVSGQSILSGESGYCEIATYEKSDTVVSAIVGAAGLMPTIAAIDNGKNIALANKETLVMAGEIVMSRAKEKGITIFPIDSEHSAIFQSMSGQRKQDIDSIIITASGGPFLEKDITGFKHIKPEDALRHPNWQMGKKITIDSATLMNKGLEVIEAKWLFDIPIDKIKVIVHPQSIVHSMVAYKDGSVIAQLGIPDMKGAIAYALSYPERLPIEQDIPDFAKIASLNFKEPDLEKFPCLGMAYEVCEKGLTYPAVLNAANEIAVNAFLNKKISFIQIPEIIKKTIAKHSPVLSPVLSDISYADSWARDFALKLI